MDRPLGTETEPFRERVIEVTATGEEAVIAKEAHVVEEITVRKDVTERTQEVADTVRRTEVEVEDERNRTPGAADRAAATKGTGAPNPTAKI